MWLVRILFADLSPESSDSHRSWSMCECIDPTDVTKSVEMRKMSHFVAAVVEKITASIDDIRR
jgi:hypothetical protein